MRIKKKKKTSAIDSIFAHQDTCSEFFLPRVSAIHKHITYIKKKREHTKLMQSFKSLVDS